MNKNIIKIYRFPCRGKISCSVLWVFFILAYLGPVFGQMNPAVVAVAVQRLAVCWPKALAQDSWRIRRTRSGSNTPPFLFPRFERLRRWRPSSFRTSAPPPRFLSFHYFYENKTVLKHYSKVVTYCILFNTMQR